MRRPINVNPPQTVEGVLTLARKIADTPGAQECLQALVCKVKSWADVPEPEALARTVMALRTQNIPNTDECENHYLLGITVSLVNLIVLQLVRQRM